MASIKHMLQSFKAGDNRIISSAYSKKTHKLTINTTAIVCSLTINNNGINKYVK
jgi:hypothetical protein